MIDFRITSKLIVISFTLPTLNPDDDEECDSFSQLDELVKDVGPSYLAKLPDMYAHYFNSSKREETKRKNQVAVILPGCHPRIVESYSSLLFFVEEVSISQLAH